MMIFCEMNARNKQKHSIKNFLDHNNKVIRMKDKNPLL